MAELPNCLMIVTVDVDPAIEDKCNRWYDAVHVPDVLACQGVVSGRRYLAAGDVSESDHGRRTTHQRRLYTTVYELESPAATQTPQFLAMRGWAHFAPHVRSQTRVVLPNAR